MPRQCNIQDIAITFLYMDSLEKRGVLKNAREGFSQEMSDDALETLKMLAEEREKMIDSQMKLNGYPSVNLISKDYVNYLEYEEELHTPVSKGVVQSRYDVDYDIDKQTIFVDEDRKSLNSSIVPNVVNSNMIVNYEDRETTISTILTVGEIMRRFGSDVSYRADDIVFSLNRSEALDVELEDLGILDKFNATLKGALSHHYAWTTKEYEDMSSVVFLPVRIGDDSLKGNKIDKDKILNLYLDEIVSYMSEAFSNETISNISERVKNLFQTEENYALFQEVLKNTQADTDAMLTNFVNTIAVSNLREAKKSITLMSGLDAVVSDIFENVSKGDMFEIDMINVGKGSIMLLPTSKKDEITIQHIDPFVLAPSKEDISNFKKFSVVPKEITLRCGIASNDSSVLIESVYPTEVNVPINTKTNTGKSKSYRVSKSYANDFDKSVLSEDVEKQRRTMIIDEADEGSGGTLGGIFAYIFKENASKIVVATGTPTNGMPESTVNILKFGGIMSSEDVAKSQLEFETLYGVYSVNSRFIALLIQGVSTNATIASSLKSIYANTMSAIKGNKTVNTDELYDKATKEIANILVDEDILDGETAMELDVAKERIQLIILFSAISKFESKHKTMDFVSLASMALTQTHTLTKKEPKVSSIKGYASTIFSTIGANAVSSTDAGAEKNIIFEDFNVYKNNFHPTEPMMNKFSFTEDNRSNVRLCQSMINKYSQMMFLSEIFVQLTQSFDGFMKLLSKENASGKALRGSVLESIKKIDKIAYGRERFIEMSESELFSLIPKSTSSADDSFTQLYKQYIKNNGDFNALGKENDDRHNMRVELLSLIAIVFNDIMKEVPLYKSKLEALRGDSRDNKKTKKETPPFEVVDNYGIKHILTGMSYKYTETVLRGDSSFNMYENVIKKLNGRAYPNDTVFSFMIDLCPNDFNDVLAPNDNMMRFPYKLDLVNRKENEVLDVISSLGIKRKMKAQILSGANVVNFSQRVVTNLANTLNFISAYKEVLDEYKAGLLTDEETYIFENYIKNKVRVVVNATSKGDDKVDIIDIFKRVPPIEGLELQLVKRTNLDGALRKSIMYDGKLTCLNSNYSSVSRGFALHYFHRDIVNYEGKNETVVSVLNFTDPVGGGNGIQALARLESPLTDTNIISLYNGGGDAKIYMFGEESDGVMNNMLPKSTATDSSTQDKKEELTSVLSAIFSYDKKEGDMVAMNVMQALDLPQSLGKAQTSINGERTQTAYTTYENVMKGKYTELTPEQAKKMYMENLVIAEANVPDDVKIELEKNNAQVPDADDVHLDNAVLDAGLLETFSKQIDADLGDGVFEEMLSNQEGMVTLPSR